MKEIFAKIQERFKNCSCFKKGGCLSPEVEDCTRVKIPFFKMVFGPFSLMLDNPRAFFSLTLPYAVILTIVSLSAGFGYICLYYHDNAAGAYCSDSLPVYLICVLLKIWIIAVFAVKWCETAFLKQPLTLKGLFLPDRRSLRLSLLILVFLLLNSMPILSGYILYVRVPNPDWRVEMFFFAVVSVGFLVPFALLRFYSLIAFAVYGNPFPNLRELWVRNSGNNLNLLGGLFLIIIFASLVFSNLFRNFELASYDATLYLSFAAEFLYDFFYLLIVILLVNYCCIQQQLIYGEQDGTQCTR